MTKMAAMPIYGKTPLTYGTLTDIQVAAVRWSGNREL